MRVGGETTRVRLDDGRATTVHTVSYSLADTQIEVVRLSPGAAVEAWCEQEGIRDDAGLTLWELADLLVDLGVHSALNLDGGSAGVIVADGRRLNTASQR